MEEEEGKRRNCNYCSEEGGKGKLKLGPPTAISRSRSRRKRRKKGIGFYLQFLQNLFCGKERKWLVQRALHFTRGGGEIPLRARFLEEKALRSAERTTLNPSSFFFLLVGLSFKPPSFLLPHLKPPSYFSQGSRRFNNLCLGL